MRCGASSASTRSGLLCRRSGLPRQMDARRVSQSNGGQDVAGGRMSGRPTLDERTGAGLLADLDVIEVHRELGPGFLERGSEEAVAVELGLRHISCVRQAVVEVRYKGGRVGVGRLDLRIAQWLRVAVKLVDPLHSMQTAQVRADLVRWGGRLTCG